MRTALRSLALLALAGVAPAQDVAFTKDVLPILEQVCFECHRADYTDSSGRLRKTKGSLRLDGKAWIQKGGKEGSVLTPGHALQSPLYTRVVLPADHEERMPATGDPLTTEQTEVLRRWIDGGASFGDWVGEPGPASAAPAEPAKAGKTTPAGTRTLDLARVAEGLSPLPEATIRKAAGDTARITPLWHGSALLRVEFPGQEDHVGDAEVQALAPLHDHIGALVLARTKVTDAACAQVARMQRLVRLDLRDTKVGDAGVSKLKGLPELRVLSLFATEVTDASLDVLRALPKLEEVRLWQTKVTAPAVAQLLASRPALDASLAPDLPAAAPPGEGQRGRRRGR